MSSSFNRRNFLRRQTTLVAAAALAPAHWSVAPAAAAEPVARDGAPKFKFSLAAYSYRNLLTGDQPQLTLHDFIDDCASMQLDGTELTSYYYEQPVSHEYLADLKAHAFRAGLDVSGIAVGNDFGLPDGEQRDEQIASVKRAVDWSVTLGASVIRVFAGQSHGDDKPEVTHRRVVAGLESACDYAGAHGVYLALENHGGPTSTADGLLALVRDVQSPWLGVNLDSGNFHSDDLYGELERIAPWALNVQVKVVVSGPDGVKRPSDFGRLAKMLRAAGYRGYIVLEYEEEHDPRIACPPLIEDLRTAFA